MEVSCPFGVAEKMLREGELPSEPDKEITVDGRIMILSGLCVYLPQFSVTVHEGILCRHINGELQPEYTVTAIVDRNTGTLLYDEECDFVECVFHWQEERLTLSQIEAQKCIVEGIEVRKRDNTMQTAQSRGNR